MKPVLFVSTRPLERAENLATIFNAFKGDKTFMQMDVRRTNEGLKSKTYKLILADEIPSTANAPVILFGHGITGGKKCYKDQEHGYVKSWEYKFIFEAVASSPEMVYISAGQLGLPTNKVHPLGMPRTDYYFGKKKGDGGTFLVQKRAYLYAPTFRNKTDPEGFELDLDYIDSKLTDMEVFVIKPHMLMKGMVKKEYKHIVEVSPNVMSRDYILDCDVLITDYSSILLDGYVADKPGVLFEKNPGYLESRGMYFKYPFEYCSRYATNEEELVNLMREANELGDIEKACRIKTASSCLDGKSTERVCNYISQKIQSI